MRMVAKFYLPFRWSLLGVSLLVVMLFSSLFVGIFVHEVNGASLENAVHVKNEDELKNAINNASLKEITIALDNDIILTEALKIIVNKDIILTSNKITGYYKLIGAEGRSTIFVDGGGVLRLDGVIVTHVKNAGAVGGGVYVDTNGMLILYSGEISGNDVIDWGDPHTPTANGGGVFNFGVFERIGGVISGNTAGVSGADNVYPDDSGDGGVF
jgi:hypothetical protein